MTAKGAAVTLSSTVVSCTMACYIEIGAHRVVYHYFPHKYVNVEYANGLTQEQLDAVRIHRVNNNNNNNRTAEENSASTTTFSETDSWENKVATETLKFTESMPQKASTSNSFWTEEKRELLPASISEAPSFFQSNEVMACAMTC